MYRNTLPLGYNPSLPQLLMQMADDFIESVVTSACKLARHRKSNTLETRDLQLHLGGLKLAITPLMILL